MMRKFIIVQFALALSCFSTTVVLAGTPDTGPGCGLGKEIWKDTKDTDTVGHHLLMSTTNNPFIPLQAGAITTGTWGCQNNRKVWTEHKANVFAIINFENLSQDMAQGRGEHLASLATLMGVPDDQQAAFFALSQERYQELLLAGQTSTAAMLTALHDAMAQHPVLAKVSMNR